MTVLLASLLLAISSPALEAHRTAHSVAEDEAVAVIVENANLMTAERREQLAKRLQFRVLVLKALMNECDYDLEATRTVRVSQGFRAGTCIATMKCRGRGEGELQNISFQCPADAAGKCPADHAECAASKVVEVIATGKDAFRNKDEIMTDTKTTHSILKKASDALENGGASEGTQ